MTKEDIVAAVKEMGTSSDFEQAYLAAKKRDRNVTIVVMGAWAVALVLLPFALSQWGEHLPGHSLYGALFFTALVIGGLGAPLTASMPTWRHSALLTRTGRSREALELVEKSPAARLVRDAVVLQGRRLVGHDLTLMRRLYAEEAAARSREVRDTDEEALSARLHVVSPDYAEEAL
jgi:hypothetical protein